MDEIGFTFTETVAFLDAIEYGAEVAVSRGEHSANVETAVCHLRRGSWERLESYSPTLAAVLVYETAKHAFRTKPAAMEKTRRFLAATGAVWRLTD